MGTLTPYNSESRYMTPEDCERFFEKLDAIYPHKCKAYTGQALALWLNTLKLLRRSTVRAALIAHVETGDIWPPGIPVFLKLVKDHESRQSARLKTYREIKHKKTPEQERHSKDTARSHVEAMRENLANSKRYRGRR